MSRYAQIHEAAIKDRRFGDAAFRTYSFLLTYMRNGCSFPKERTIAQEMGLARSTVSGHLNAAAKLGYLIIESRFRSDGGRASNDYRVPDDLKVAATAKLAVDGCSGDNGSPIRFFDSPPVSPDPTAPVSPDPTAPVSPDPTAPVSPDPTAPRQPRPDSPRQPRPDSPRQPRPDSPRQPRPDSKEQSREQSKRTEPPLRGGRAHA